jgi:hypothetical protein
MIVNMKRPVVMACAVATTWAAENAALFNGKLMEMAK